MAKLTKAQQNVCICIGCTEIAYIQLDKLPVFENIPNLYFSYSSVIHIGRLY